METQEVNKNNQLPWLERDHQRIRSLVEAIALASRRTATQFVLHRLLEELRTLCAWHFDRQHHALSRAGLALEHGAEQADVLKRLVDAQSQLRTGQAWDKKALVDFLVEWVDCHLQQCAADLVSAAGNSSRSTHWDLYHVDAIHPNKMRVSIPLDPQTSGLFMV